jgi:hypothetical protein
MPDVRQVRNAVANYLTSAAIDQIDHAQAVINHHLADCLECCANRPCTGRREADAVFARYQRLPRRTPGLSGAGKLGGNPVNWFRTSGR